MVVDDLYIEIRSESSQAVSGIDALANSLSKLKTITRGGVGLTTVANQVKRFNDAVKQMSDPSEKIANLVSALKPLETIGKPNLNSTLNSLKKIPEITQQLASIDMGAFETQIRRATDAIRPLADEMNKVAQGFSAFPSRIQRLITQNERLSSSNRRTGSSYKSIWNPLTGLIAKTTLYIHAMQRVSRTIAGWVIESNDYVENLNLFNVSMREYADEALRYANEVRDAFGIDPSEWIRYQAVFQNMATGFGVASDQAAIMSKTLTQLGYDLATLFNVDYETAMQKLQSGIAGQPRPMREWGFDMSESTLKLTALNLGIRENVELMTQHEKSQLRFVQIMETARKQGILQNFSREIITPANALRILNQQVVQLRRALGDMLIPILIKIIPYVQAFVRVLTDAARAIAAFFGFELPKIDYSGLGEIGGAFDDMEDGADGANSAAKKLRNTLAGFDEINLLTQPTDGSGRSGAGGGIGGTDLGIDFSDYEYDFLGNVENEVNQIVDNIYDKIQPVVDFVRDNFEHIKDIGIAIAAGLLAWKIAPGVISLFSSISNLFTKGATGKLLSPEIGIAITIGGIVLGAKGLAKLVEGSTDIKDIIQTAIGYALGIAVPLLTFGTGPLGWSIAAVATLAITIGGIALGMDSKYKQSEIGKYVASLEDIQKEAQGAIDKVDKLMRNIRDSRATFSAEWGAVDALARKYYDLATKTDLANDEKNLLIEYGRMLVGEIPELIDLIDLETGAYKGTGDELFKLIDQTKEYYRLQAARDDLIKLYEAQYEVEKQLAIIGDERTEIERKIKEQEEKRNTILKEKNLFLGEGIGEYWETSRAIKDLQSNYEGLTTKGGILENQQKDITKEINYSTKILEGWSDTAGTALEGVNRKVKGFKLAKLSLEIDVKNPVIKTTTTGSGKQNVVGRIQAMAYAGGGFPTEGEFFLAREAGPELVGTIGNRTAVANNDQIVDGIRAGVSTANQEQNSLLQEQNALLKRFVDGSLSIHVDGNEFGRVAATSINSASRQIGRNILNI